MNNNLLITFGCSWTYGVGVNYQPGLTKDMFIQHAWDQDLCDKKSFRGILSSELGLDNVNFSSGGSSNQRQFRLAKQYFVSKAFLKAKKKYKNITVIWGITSTARNELYNIQTKKIENFSLYTEKHPVAKPLIKYSYDHNNEVKNLSMNMKFWNKFFENLGITNFWFDTFNHHNYGHFNNTIDDYQSHYSELAGPDWPSWQKFTSGDMKSVPLHIVKEIYRIKVFGDFLRENHPRDHAVQRLIEQSTLRDLASYLAIKHGWDYTNSRNDYHYSDWKIDSEKIQYLSDLHLLNPWSNHPTEKCHLELAEFFKPYIKI